MTAPKLAYQVAKEDYEAGVTLPRAPHCDPRILHLPEECKFCAEAVELQEERVRLDVSNSGHQNRWWACPADRERGPESYNKWGGNRPATEAQLAAENALLLAEWDDDL